MAKIVIIVEDDGEDLKLDIKSDPEFDMDHVEDWTPAQQAGFFMYETLSSRLDSLGLESETFVEDEEEF